jgi:hypothetical protein
MNPLFKIDDPKKEKKIQISSSMLAIVLAAMMTASCAPNSDNQTDIPQNKVPRDLASPNNSELETLFNEYRKLEPHLRTNKYIEEISPKLSSFIEQKNNPKPSSKQEIAAYFKLLIGFKACAKDVVHINTKTLQKSIVRKIDGQIDHTLLQKENIITIIQNTIQAIDNIMLINEQLQPYLSESDMEKLVEQDVKLAEIRNILILTAAELGKLKDKII